MSLPKKFSPKIVIFPLRGIFLPSGRKFVDFSPSAKFFRQKWRKFFFLGSQNHLRTFFGAPFRRCRFTFFKVKNRRFFAIETLCMKVSAFSMQGLSQKKSCGFLIHSLGPSGRPATSILTKVASNFFRGIYVFHRNT